MLLKTIHIGVQNSEHFQSVDDINFFHGHGQRVSQLTYKTRNLIGNGSTERRDEGLSVQMQTDEKMRGQVMSIFMLAFRGGIPLGNLTAGFVAHELSPTIALTANGIVLVTIASLFLVSKSAVKEL